jgi:hypothetical protein
MGPYGGGYVDVAPTTHPKARHENHQLSCLDLPERSYFRKRTLTGGRPPVGAPSGLSGHGQSRRMDGAAQILSL